MKQFIIGFLGAILMMRVLGRGFSLFPENIMPEFSNHIIIIACLWVIIGIILHELGHLFCGLATGYKFNSLQLGNLLWFKVDKKIKLRFSKAFELGQCLMEPSENELEFKYFWYNFGGIFVNLIIVLISLLALRVGGLNDFWSDFFLSGAILNGVFMLMNGIPIPATYNDGSVIYSLSKSQDARRGFRASMILYCALNKGHRYRDLSPELFKVEKHANLKNYWIANLVLLEYARLDDLGEVEAEMKELQRLNVEKVPKVIKLQVKINLIYYHLTVDADYQRARELYECKTVKNSLHGITRAQVAYTYFALDEKLSGKALLKQAEKEIERLPYKGLQEMEFEELEKLKALMA